MYGEDSRSDGRQDRDHLQSWQLTEEHEQTQTECSGHQSHAHGETVMETDAGRDGHRGFDDRNRGRRLHFFFDKHRFVALRLATLLAESPIGGGLWAASTKLRHASR